MQIAAAAAIGRLWEKLSPARSAGTSPDGGAPEKEGARGVGPALLVRNPIIVAGYSPSISRTESHLKSTSSALSQRNVASGPPQVMGMLSGEPPQWDAPEPQPASVKS